MASLKHALKQNDLASSLNITLQQEVTRLTEENLVSGQIISTCMWVLKAPIIKCTVFLRLVTLHVNKSGPTWRVVLMIHSIRCKWVSHSLPILSSLFRAFWKLLRWSSISHEVVADFPSPHTPHEERPTPVVQVCLISLGFILHGAHGPFQVATCIIVFMYRSQVWNIRSSFCSCGVHYTVSPRKRTAVRFRGWEEQTPALGMLSWQPEDQSKLIKALVLDLRPESFHGLIPCLPAHMIFMCLRYLDHCNDQQKIAQFTEGIVMAIEQVMQVRNQCPFMFILMFHSTSPF